MTGGGTHLSGGSRITSLFFRRVALMSDLHLAPDDPAGIEQFVKFTKTLPGRADAFAVLGDLFEAYVGTKHLRVSGYRPVVEAFQSLHRAGIDVTVLAGNRDFLLDRGFERATGARAAGDEFAFESGGRRFLLTHGDLFCIRDVRYQRMRKKLRSRAFRLLPHVLPLSVSLQIAGRLRKASKEEILAKTPAEMGIVDTEVAAKLGLGYDFVVCGHVHDPRVTRLDNGTLVVLPAWPAPPGTCWIRDGELSFEDVPSLADSRSGNL